MREASTLLHELMHAVLGVLKGVTVPMRIKNFLVSYRVRTPTGLTPLAISVFQVAEMCVIDDDAPLSEESPWVDKISADD